MRVILAFLVSCTAFVSDGQVLRKRTALLMGGRFDITIISADSATAETRIDEVIAEITRIEYLISDWKPQTRISDVNRNAGIRPVQVDREVFELTRRAIRLSEITKGAFDISFAALDRIWRFDGSMTEMPSAESVRKSVAKVGYYNIVLDSVNSTIFLKMPGMKIGFGALGEGYAVDRCRELMRSKGVEAGIVNASGDLIAWGRQPDGTDWKIGITNPFDTNAVVGVIPLSDGAATTSGSYEKFVEFDGRRYSHIIDPVTGYPVTGLCSVTVLGPSAEVANGLSTSIMVLGRKKGMRLLRRFPTYRCLIITDTGRIIRSRNWISKS